MVRFLLSFFFIYVFIGCSGQTTDSSGRYLSIAKAPINSNTPISRTQRFSISFDTTLDANSINVSTVYIARVDTNQSVGTALEVDGTQSKITITPFTYLQPNTTYKIVVTTGIKDSLGRSLSQDFVQTFTTAADTTTSPQLAIRSVKPKDNEVCVIVDTDIVLDFNQFISSAAQYDGLVYLDVKDENTSASISGEVEVFNSLLRFTPSYPLPYDTNISVTLTGNIFDIDGKSSVTAKTFSFTTQAALFAVDSNVSNKGYKALASLNTSKASYKVKKVQDVSSVTSFFSIVAVGTENSVDIYDINYTDPSGLPTIKLLQSYSLPSKVNSLAVSKRGDYLFVATQNDGLYEFITATSPMTLAGHYLTGKSLYRVKIGAADINTEDDRVYAVGPDYGLEIYDFNATTGVVTSKTTVPSSDLGIPLDVADVSAYDNTAQQTLRKLYVADYNGSVVILDENGTSLSRTDINGSVKSIIVNSDYNGPYNLLVASSSGSVQGIGFDGAQLSNVKTTLPGSMHGGYNYVDDKAFKANAYYAIGSKGFVVANGDFISRVVKTQHDVVDLNVVKFQGSGTFYLLLVSTDGTLTLYNADFDTESPMLYSTTPADGATDVATNIKFIAGIDDRYLNYATITKDAFSFRDNNTTQAVDFTISATVEGQWELTPTSPLLAGHEYTVNISGTIADQLGNKFNAGVDKNITFTTAP